MAGNYDFTIIKTKDYLDFCKEIKSRLNDGWQLHGNMIAFSDHAPSGNGEESIMYVQAMVKDIRDTSSVGFRRSR